MPRFIQVPMLGNWEGIHYGVIRDKPMFGVCGEHFRLQISRWRLGMFSGTLEEDSTSHYSTVKGSWNNECLRFTRRRTTFIIEHEEAVVSLNAFLIIMSSAVARYQVQEPAFEYEGWYDPELGEISGHWYWPGFQSVIARTVVKVGSMRGYWRMKLERVACR